jgi:peptidoglycan/xylan/chitin deacetylase (PgdA/CDA1 family)
MYHYVRDLANSKYPEIKARTIKEFQYQLDYLQDNYSIIRMEDLIAYVDKGTRLPDNALLLTFDDGYADHFNVVFPILQERGLQGSFFPSGKAVIERKMMTVNKIHFLLAMEKPKRLMMDIFTLMNKDQDRFQLKSLEEYIRKVARPSRFDPPEVIFVKRMLQRELPEALRKKIATKLFWKYISKDERSFADELYLNSDQLRQMKDSGMFIGSHGYDHCWMNTLTPQQQRIDISASLEFLESLGIGSPKVICYPQGAYNESLLEILKTEGFILGLTTSPEVADLEKDDLLILPRVDTNDLPCGPE